MSNYNRLLVDAFKTVVKVHSGYDHEVSNTELLHFIRDLNEKQKESPDEVLLFIKVLLTQVQGYLFAWGEYSPLPSDTWNILAETCLDDMISPRVVH